jgi:preprotein translocase subunit YajC
MADAPEGTIKFVPPAHVGGEPVTMPINGTATTSGTGANPLPLQQPGAMDIATYYALQIGVFAFIVLLFYVLVILPQQKRIKRHNKMLGGVRKGDEVITAGGFIARVVKSVEGEDRIVLDLGKGVEVTALRSSVHAIVDK